ncbi:hypothetical protein OBBRIDRAFT_881848, partial [Obba rivulosa]
GIIRRSGRSRHYTSRYGPSVCSVSPCRPSRTRSAGLDGNGALWMTALHITLSRRQCARASIARPTAPSPLGRPVCLCGTTPSADPCALCDPHTMLLPRPAPTAVLGLAARACSALAPAGGALRHAYARRDAHRVAVARLYASEHPFAVEQLRRGPCPVRRAHENGYDLKAGYAGCPPFTRRDDHI